MRNLNNPRRPLTASEELAIQMERAVRPAEASLAEVEARLANIEAGSRQANADFVQADANFQKLAARKAPVEEVEAANAARGKALEAKRLVAEWLVGARKDLTAAKARLETARGFAARLQARVQDEVAEAAHRREVEATAKLLCSLGVNPRSAQKAAVAPPRPVSVEATPVSKPAQKAKEPVAPKRPGLKLEGLAEAWGAAVAVG